MGDVALDWPAIRAAAEVVELVQAEVGRPPWSAVYRVVVAGEERFYLVGDDHQHR